MILSNHGDWWLLEIILWLLVADVWMRLFKYWTRRVK